MDNLFSSSTSLVWTLGFTILVTSIAVFARSSKWTSIQRFRQRNKDSGSTTPPRSLSPKKNLESQSKSSTSNTYAELPSNFPPSRRAVLSQLLAKSELSPEPTADDMRDRAASSSKEINYSSEKPQYTPTGFSTSEVKALGAFPAYDILSGVPLPNSYEGFDATKALARPYRPLRWAYHQTMSFKKIEPDWWLEVEKSYCSTIAKRRALYEQHGKAVLDCLPGSEIACKELMEMCLQFYCARYPAYFSISTDKKTFHNRLLNETTDLDATPPLQVILNNVPEDFAMVFRNEKDGLYYFRAGVICSALGWSVATKIGMPLEEIHKPIPDYKERMAMSMDRFFSKMPTDAPIQRGSWGLENGTPLFMPPGDPHEALRDIQQADLTPEECYLRVDWQTLRRLPLSGAVVFNFKALFTPITEFRDEPYIPALLLKILKEGKESLMKYKGTWHVEHVCIPTLEEYAAEQIANGLVKEGEDWKVSTLEEYPYFPGWEEKWHRQQGF